MPLLRYFLNRAANAPEEPMDPESSTFWTHIIVSAGLVLLGGVFAGLTLGLMGLDELHLRVLSASSDDPVERQNAKTGVCL
jgi:metal transporter CNNM